MSREIHIQEVPSAAHVASSRVKPPPVVSKIPIPFSYSVSDDGTDENLLILLHGLGDTNVPFQKLGKQLHLPQTATLSIRAPQQIPFLDEPAFQWYPSFTLLGELIERPNPTPALDLISKLIDHLTRDCGWPLGSIHFFGFAQGGSVAVEAGFRAWKRISSSSASTSPSPSALDTALGSIVSVSGPLLSYPTVSLPCPTPVLFFNRSTSPMSDVTAMRKAYTMVESVRVDGEEGMPRDKSEWEPIMRFWSEKLRRRKTEGLYEVLSGAPA